MRSFKLVKTVKKAVAELNKIAADIENEKISPEDGLKSAQEKAKDLHDSIKGEKIE